MRGSNRYITKGMTEDVIVGDWEFSPWQPICTYCELKILKRKDIRYHSVSKEVLCRRCFSEAEKDIADERVMLEMDRLREMGVRPPRHVEDAILYGLDNEWLDYWD